MAVNLFLTTALLSIAGSTAYILLKLLTVASGDRLSQNWRYHSITAVSLLFVLPLHKLWALIPVPHRGLPSVIAISGNSDPVYTPSSSTATSELPLQVGPTNGGVVWKLVIEQAAVLWMLVAVGLILWNVWRLLHYRRQFEQASNEVNGHLRQIAQKAARLAGVTDEVRLLASPLVQSPMLVGFFRPTIVLPSEHLPDSDAQFILTHELTHFRRRDLWKKFLVNMIQCIHWFNPIVYLLNRDFAYWLETSCDEEVVSSLNYAQRKEYGYLLINYAPTTRHVGPRLYVSFTSCRYKLKRRISIMMKSNKKSRSLLGLMLALALIVSCLATTAFAAAASDVEQTVNVNSDGTVVSIDDVVAIADNAVQTIALDAGTIQVGTPSTADEEQVPVDDTVTDMGDIMPLASGELAAHQGYSYGSVTVGAGKTLTVSATYTPTNATMRIGYVNSDNIATYVNISGGSGSHTFTISKAGTYSIYIYNSSNYDVEYSTSYLAT